MHSDWLTEEIRNMAPKCCVLIGRAESACVNNFPTAVRWKTLTTNNNYCPASFLPIFCEMLSESNVYEKIKKSRGVNQNNAVNNGFLLIKGVYCRFGRLPHCFPCGEFHETTFKKKIGFGKCQRTFMIYDL